MAKKSISDVLINFKGENRDLDKSIRGSGEKLRGFASSAVKNLAKVGVALGLVAVAASAYSIKQGMTFNQLKRGFESLTKNVGVNSDKFLRDLQKMSHGTVSNADIIQNANKAMLLDIDPKAITTMMKGSAAIAQATGQDVNYMFESLSMGIARQSPMLLDNLGIKIKLGEVNEQLADKLGVHIDALTDEQKAMAFQDAAMDGVTKRLVAIGGYTVDTKTKWDQLTTSFKNASVILGQDLMPEFDEILTWVLDNKDWMITTFDEIFDIEVGKFGEAAVTQLDKVKNWIDENKSSIKWLVDAVKGIFEWRTEAIAVKERERTDIEQRGYGARRQEAFGQAASAMLPRWEQSISIVLDHYSADKFLKGEVVTVANSAVIAGT